MLLRSGNAFVLNNQKMYCTNTRKQLTGNVSSSEPTCGRHGQQLLRRLRFLLWCRELLLQALELLFVFQQVSRLQVVDVQREVLAQDLDLKLEVQLVEKVFRSERGECGAGFAFKASVRSRTVSGQLGRRGDEAP